MQERRGVARSIVQRELSKAEVKDRRDESKVTAWKAQDRRRLEPALRREACTCNRPLGVSAVCMHDFTSLGG